MKFSIKFEGETLSAIHDAVREYLGDEERGGAVVAAVQEAASEQSAPAKRGRKPKAAAPQASPGIAHEISRTTEVGQVAAAPNPAAPTPAEGDKPQSSGTTSAAAGTPLGPDAVAPGGAVFLAVKAFNDKHGMEKARELLAKFGAGMVRQIKPSDYEAVIAACAA